MQCFYAASLLLNRNVLWVWLPTSLPFSKTSIWAGPNYFFQATMLLTSDPFLGTAHALSLMCPCVCLLAVRSILLLLTFFSAGFWARLFCAIGEVSNSLSLRDGVHSLVRILRLLRPLCRCLQAHISCPLQPVRFISFSWLGLRALSQGR